MRSLVAITMFGAGLVLAAVSYLWLAAPLGQPTSEVYSNPRLLGAPALFILGIMLIFLSAVAYELWPDRSGRGAH
jgi:hypothetical protein